jgi:hypothetical protein
LRIGLQCVFCSQIIEQGDAQASIQMIDSASKISPFQLDAHLRCLQQAAHPKMVERVDPTYDVQLPGSQ